MSSCGRCAWCSLQRLCNLRDTGPRLTTLPVDNVICRTRELIFEKELPHEDRFASRRIGEALRDPKCRCGGCEEIRITPTRRRRVSSRETVPIVKPRKSPISACVSGRSKAVAAPPANGSSCRTIIADSADYYTASITQQSALLRFKLMQKFPGNQLSDNHRRRRAVAHSSFERIKLPSRFRIPACLSAAEPQRDCSC